MRKPIGNFYTVIWVEIPDDTARNGTLTPSNAAMEVFWDVRSRLSRSWQGPRLAGALSGAMALLALVFTRS